MVATDVLETSEVDVAPVPAVQVPTVCAADPAAISAAMQVAFGKLMPYVARKKLTPTGPPRAIYTDFNMKEARFTLGLPIAPGAVPLPEAANPARISGSSINTPSFRSSWASPGSSM